MSLYKLGKLSAELQGKDLMSARVRVFAANAPDALADCTVEGGEGAPKAGIWPGHRLPQFDPLLCWRLSHYQCLNNARNFRLQNSGTGSPGIKGPPERVG